MRGSLTILVVATAATAAATPPEMRHRVFTYGSLMRGLHNHHLLSSAQLLGAARTAASSYVLVDSGLGFPFAIDAASRETRHPRTALLGECYAVDDATLEKMDVLEGHPDWYRRKQVALEGEDEPAWAYLLIDEETLARAEREMASCADGDWRTRATAEVGWADTKLTLEGDGPFAVFSFGSNGVAQLRERCGNPAITARRAEMREAARVFGGWSTRWDGAVASVVRKKHTRVRGSVSYLTQAELKKLDVFELGHGDADDPYDAAAGVYRRQDATVLIDDPAASGEALAVLEKGNPRTPLSAVLYVKNEAEWEGPPSAAYVEACRRNLAEIWPEAIVGEELVVRDGSGEARS